MLVVMLLALAAPNPRALDVPRKAYSTCIRAFENRSLEAKMDPVAYAAALKASCTAEAAALARALTEYDIAMGSKRAAAMATAESDVADYRLTSEERFRDMITVAKGN
jgi:hypothetical protein